MTKDELIKKLDGKIRLVHRETFNGVSVMAYRIEGYGLVQLTAKDGQKRIFMV